jgi:hypothetical protein
MQTFTVSTATVHAWRSSQLSTHIYAGGLLFFQPCLIRTDGCQVLMWEPDSWRIRHCVLPTGCSAAPQLDCSASSHLSTSFASALHLYGSCRAAATHRLPPPVPPPPCMTDSTCTA